RATCATKYPNGDDNVRSKFFNTRCKKCSHTIVVQGEAATVGPGHGDASVGAMGDQDAGATVAGSHADPGAGDRVWFLVVNGEQVGPFTAQEVRMKHAGGEVDLETYGWREGFADWLRVGSIDDFRDL